MLGGRGGNSQSSGNLQNAGNLHDNQMALAVTGHRLVSVSFMGQKEKYSTKNSSQIFYKVKKCIKMFFLKGTCQGGFLVLCCADALKEAGGVLWKGWWFFRGGLWGVLSGKF